MKRIALYVVLAMFIAASSALAGLVIKSSAPSFVCGTSTVLDADGNSYNTVLINDQCWQASNMRVGTMLSGAFSEPPTDNSIIEKFCYNNTASNCVTYGGLYRWREAMGYSTTPGSRGICPEGWHIPTDGEWFTLSNFLKDEGQPCSDSTFGWQCSTAGTKLKSGGSSGFNGELGGVVYWASLTLGDPFDYVSWEVLNSYGQWITSNWLSDDPILYRLHSGSTTIKRDHDANNRWYLHSVRCLKD
jgi:uncharacterized protein (TIGR02145 family)